jgi:phosphate transport system substrate-binding protein
MKKLIVIGLLALGAVAHGQNKQVFAGSDTLAGAMTDAIIQAGMDQTINYIGGGSGNAEKNLVSGDQGIGPMSREMKPEFLQKLQEQGNSVKAHVLALDGISVFVQKGNAVPVLDVTAVTKIFTCQYTRWEQVPGSGVKGEIHAYRRNDTSGTTDAFKHFTGIKNFGPCVTMVEETADISDKTSRDLLAVGYAGLSGKVADNRSVALAATPGTTGIMPTTATIRNGSYPFARKLLVYEISGRRSPSAAEQNLLSYLTDRSFMDPIMQAHEFVTID